MADTSYYAHIDKSEAFDDRVYLEFHCLEIGYADGILSFSRPSFRNAILENKDQVIIVDQLEQQVKSYLPPFETTADAESEWVVLYTNTSGEGLPGQLFVENADGPAPIYIGKMEHLREGDSIRKTLEEQISLDDFDDADSKEILATLTVNLPETAEFVAVYNVGQGNCNAICDNRSVPLFYFDLGGGCYANKHTYPSPLGFCFSFAPPILLSHWDADHYQSAKSNSLALVQDWVVPRQKIGPVHFKFFLGLKGKKLIWPNALSSLSTGFGEIILCTGSQKKKNHSGLAFAVSLSAAVNNIREVLLPADAAYTFIPGITKRSFDALVITHHGANFDFNNAPVVSPGIICAIAYSYGVHNTYHHPKLAAVGAHAVAGWNNIRETRNGHIAFLDHNNIPQINCGSKNCQLQIVQHF